MEPRDSSLGGGAGAGSILLLKLRMKRMLPPPRKSQWRSRTQSLSRYDFKQWNKSRTIAWMSEHEARGTKICRFEAKGPALMSPLRLMSLL